MVVDDQAGIRVTLAGIMEDEGHRVAQAKSGYEAVELASRTDFDLIFMDIRMPGMNGIEAYYEIKRIRPDSAVVSKPFDVPYLLDVANSILRRISAEHR